MSGVGMHGYWSWWAGAIGLSGIALLSWFLLGRLLGVSSSWARVVTLGEDEGPARPRDHDGHLRWTPHLAFLAALTLGGSVVAIASGHWQWHPDLGDVHRHLFGTRAAGVLLFIGGVLVGFGTQMAGGCTSGHGLNGVSRLVPASLLATGLFLGVAVIVSFLIEVVVR
jgi:hypothetical protein